MKSFIELPNELFKIYDTETNEYWLTSYKPKGVWQKVGFAKSAWTSQHWKTNEKFNDQTRFVIHKFTVENWIMEQL